VVEYFAPRVERNVSYPLTGHQGADKTDANDPSKNDADENLTDLPLVVKRFGDLRAAAISAMLQNINDPDELKLAFNALGVGDSREVREGKVPDGSVLSRVLDAAAQPFRLVHMPNETELVLGPVLFRWAQQMRGFMSENFEPGSDRQGRYTQGARCRQGSSFDRPSPLRGGPQGLERHYQCRHESAILARIQSQSAGVAK
jgi:hypothetical protein